MYEELIRVQGAAARVVCAGITARQLAVLQDSVQLAAGLPDGTGWDRRAAAHGQVFTLLAAAAGDSIVAAILGSGAEHLRDLAIGAGPEAAGILASSHRRLLAHLRAGDAGAAAAEIEGLFRALHVMHRASRSAGHASHQCGTTDPRRFQAVGDAVA
jgi:DNA-binding GntR family transcriptional regulator